MFSQQGLGGSCASSCLPDSVATNIGSQVENTSEEGRQGGRVISPSISSPKNLFDLLGEEPPKTKIGKKYPVTAEYRHKTGHTFSMEVPESTSDYCTNCTSFSDEYVPFDNSKGDVKTTDFNSKVFHPDGPLIGFFRSKCGHVVLCERCITEHQMGTMRPRPLQCYHPDCVTVYTSVDNDPDGDSLDPDETRKEMIDYVAVYNLSMDGKVGVMKAEFSDNLEEARKYFYQRSANWRIRCTPHIRQAECKWEGKTGDIDRYLETCEGAYYSHCCGVYCWNDKASFGKKSPHVCSEEQLAKDKQRSNQARDIYGTPQEAGRERRRQKRRTKGISDGTKGRHISI